MLVEVLLGVFFLWVLWEACRKPKGLPPGPWGLPLLGHPRLPLLPKEERIKQLRAKHGDIFMSRTGMNINVFLCRYELCKEVCNRAEFADRPDWKAFNFMANGENAGIVGSNGVAWQDTRRFTVRHLRDLGMGRSSIVDSILLEAREMIRYIESRSEGLTDLDKFISIAVLNVIWQMVANYRYDIFDDRSAKVHNLLKNLQMGFEPMATADFFPWLTKILPIWIQKKIFAYEGMMQLREDFTKHIRELAEDHKATLDPSKPRDFIDAFLIEMDARKNDPESTFGERGLFTTVWDLFEAGSDTIASTLRWIILYMATYPEVQKKVQQEIDDFIPSDRQPSWEDKPKLPYTEAVFYEVHRITSLVSLGVTRYTIRDTTIGEYRIPKGAIIYPVIFTSHNDKTHWESPSVFMPERFLNADKMFENPRDGFMPFGVGRRQCPGEPLAKMEIFIFATSLLQKFFFSPGPDGVNLRPMDIPIMNFSHPQLVKFSLRK